MSNPCLVRWITARGQIGQQECISLEDGLLLLLTKDRKVNVERVDLILDKTGLHCRSLTEMRDWMREADA